jgi:hypothetical protein
MTTNVNRFIELQLQINNQIDTVGQADHQLADELEYLSDQLTNSEINEVVDYYNAHSEIFHSDDEYYID